MDKHDELKETVESIGKNISFMNKMLFSFTNEIKKVTENDKCIRVTKKQNEE